MISGRRFNGTFPGVGCFFSLVVRVSLFQRVAAMRESFAYRLSIRVMLALMLLNGAAYSFALPGAWICPDGTVCSQMRTTGRDLGMTQRMAPVSSAAPAKSLPKCCKHERVSTDRLASTMNCRFSPVPQARVTLTPSADKSHETMTAASTVALDLASLIERYQEKPVVAFAPPSDTPLPDTPDSRDCASRAPPLLSSIR
jgi:hypothetical protein